MLKLKDNKLLIASGNKGKIREIEALLKPFDVDILSAKNFDLQEPVEDGDSFIANAKIKSLYYAQKTGFSALSDDSGLCVDALGGDPGIYSARWAGEEKDFSKAIEKIQNLVGDNTNLKAKFVCALSLYDIETQEFYNFQGEVNGKLSFPPSGEGGFGYDPIFIADGMDQCFAEINPAIKHKISHRAVAFKKLIDECFSGGRSVF